MSNSYVAVSPLIFALVAVGHVVRLVNRWTVVIGPYNVSMNVSWAALVVSALIAIWGFMQLRTSGSSHNRAWRVICLTFSTDGQCRG
jgi:hypothetical protein